MVPLKSLKTFTAFKAMQICCNGFLGTVCDLTQAYCQVGKVTCLADDSVRVTAATRAVFQANPASMCQVEAVEVYEEMKKVNIDMCAGVLFRQCLQQTMASNGSTMLTSGMCVNSRMQVLACSPDPPASRNAM